MSDTKLRSSDEGKEVKYAEGSEWVKAKARSEMLVAWGTMLVCGIGIVGWFGSGGRLGLGLIWGGPLVVGGVVMMLQEMGVVMARMERDPERVAWRMWTGYRRMLEREPRFKGVGVEALSLWPEEVVRGSDAEMRGAGCVHVGDYVDEGLADELPGKRHVVRVYISDEGMIGTGVAMVEGVTRMVVFMKTAVVSKFEDGLVVKTMVGLRPDGWEWPGEERELVEEELVHREVVERHRRKVEAKVAEGRVPVAIRTMEEVWAFNRWEWERRRDHGRAVGYLTRNVLRQLHANTGEDWEEFQEKVVAAVEEHRQRWLEGR